MNPCTFCGREFSNSDLQSSRDKYFCKDCFKPESSDGQQLTTNVTDEKKTEPQHKCEGDAPPERKRIFSMAALAAIKREKDKSHEYSKRPLRCPHVDCNRSVSVFGLWTHFEYDHIKVPIIQTLLDARNSLAFHAKELRYRIKNCLGLLNISPPMEQRNNNRDARTPEIQQLGATLSVLASRAPKVQFDEEDYEDFLEDDESTATTPENDDVIIWIASNIVCNYSCSVAVSTISEDARVEYHGPVVQLRKSPNKLYLEGRCLILGRLDYLRISENGLKPLRVDVIVHSKD